MAALAAFSVLALAVLTASPTAHEWVHENEVGDHADHPSGPDHSDHVCPVTLAQQGFCDTTPQLTGAIAPAHLVERGVSAPQFVRWAAPDHWLQPAQGPPVQ